MSDLFFEDFHVGRQFSTEPVSLSEDEIIAFARRYDPQPFHTDPEAAKASPYGGLIASGFHTVAAAAGQFIRTGAQAAAGLGGPGMRNIRWTAPVRPGDRLYTTVEVAEARPSRSKPDRGLVCLRYTTRTEAETVMTFEVLVFFQRRPAGARSRPC